MSKLITLLRVRYPRSPAALLVLILIAIGWSVWITVTEALFLRRIRSCTDLITGTVSAMTEVSRGRHGSRFVPNIKYTYMGRDGEEHTDFYEPDHHYTYDEFSVGMEVYLFRDPHDGTNVYLSGEKERAWKAIFLPLGILLALILAYIIGSIA